MAERGVTGPFFYRGYFNHRSILSEVMSKEARVQYRGIYRSLLKAYPKTYKGKMQARAAIRSMLYSDYPAR